MKRVFSLAAALLLMVFAVPFTARALQEPEDMSSSQIILIDADSGTVLFEKNADERAFPASTTKIMTCILALEKGNLDEIITAPSVTNRGSLMSGREGDSIRKGETMSLRSLLYGMMLMSGNDAAEVVATHIGGTRADFIDMMNQKARELEMTGTNFMAASGLHNDEHYTTAKDFARLTRYAMMESPKKNDFCAIIAQKTYTVSDSSVRTYELKNTNRLLYTPDSAKESFEYRGTIGVKTGSTPADTECLVSAAKRDGVTLILVQFGDSDSASRFRLAAELFDWGFSNFVTHPASELALPETVEVRISNASFGADSNKLPLRVELSGKEIRCLKDDWAAMQANASAIQVNTIPVGELVAPIEEGAMLATVVYKFEGKVLFQADAYATQSVEPLTSGQNNDNAPTIVVGPLVNNQSSNSWVFWVLVACGLALIVGIVLLLRNRNKRKRRRRMVVRRPANGRGAPRR